ncbi:UNVERIFIED_CONTAM: hypothetical protein GTU68_058879 [Idotea baltica]|nr:hypothetical protein [Idotea baltica]
MLILLACLIGASTADQPYFFSDGYLEILGAEPQQTFTCENRPYGYYADVPSECRVFHVCHPLSNEAGEVISIFQYSFFCGNQTIFSQESLTCAHPHEAFPCDQAESIFEESNIDFGKIPEEQF